MHIRFSIVVIVGLLFSVARPASAGLAVPANPAVPDSATVVGTPLPLTCPGNLAPGPCLYGYVYYDGTPVAGASVTIDSWVGEVVVSTSSDVASADPYCKIKIHSAPLLATAGAPVTLTARF